MPLPPATLGRLIENRIIELLLVLSDGALVCYRPESDFEGTDLHVNKKHLPGEIRIQIKGRARHEPGGNLKAEVQAVDIPDDDPKYIVVVEYFPKRAALGKFLWVIHSDEFRLLGRLSGGMWRASMSPSNTAKDRWVDFRYNVNDLPWVITVLIERRARGKKLPCKADEVRALVDGAGAKH